MPLHVPFIDNDVSSGNRVMAAWLNGVNNHTYGPVTNLTGDGTTLVFTTAGAARSVYINGVYQNINTYTTTSASITFSQAPPYTSLIEVVCN
ncbi:hypothetical protein UFOVP1147_3 [uncultured Caudovirales phage]|uniref:Uncharacterized protein n=1 Tax=uncultured Caudovirales phage TaxID=2100421 RepID=A0A6J5MKJ8_9CAUD|nr:hypothetical protein UFOVP484_12 [uncultured Caudovirales phage]CAB4163568.1 hypothetical protein UFOVP808_28 [uncultured Caudovirales phage]CAB4175999.1 hypothetical protein UFOVP994_57 [uncultured Caudovirales phage]CAB4186456.1 hypothetical protein UFOVP1147_3 [uncultured Caudovirales phage]CAB4217673.1 hypothetical protein UFOVP1594_57 [uncultured Caudovirales phage]